MQQPKAPEVKCDVCGKKMSGYRPVTELKATRIFIVLSNKKPVELCGVTCERRLATQIRDETIQKGKAWRGRLRQAIRAKVQEPATDL